MENSATVVQPLPTGGQQIVKYVVYYFLENDKNFVASAESAKLLTEKFKARFAFGEKKYHQPLMTFDGLDTDTEIEQELLDACAYSLKGFMETEKEIYIEIFFAQIDLLQKLLKVKP